MVLTQKEAKQAYNHILDNVLGRSDGTALKSSLYEEGIEDIFDLINLSHATINCLSYKDTSNNNIVTPIRLGDKILLRCFANYVANCHLEGNPIIDDWSMVTQEDFDSFRIDPKNMLSLASNAPPNIPDNIAAKPTSAVQYTPVDTFFSGIKQDETLLPTLKDAKFNASWNNSFANQPRAQDVNKVLDTNHAPPTANEEDLYTAPSSVNSKLPPGDIQGVISKASKIFVNKCKYLVSKHDQTYNMSPVDHGTSGVAGNEVCVLFKTVSSVDIKGIDNTHFTNVPIETVGGVVSTQKGPVIANMHQYALLGNNSSIHSPCQLELYQNDLNDKIHVTGGFQQNKTFDGYVIPLVVQTRFARLHIGPYTNTEWKSLPHVIPTAEDEWEPTIIGHKFKEDDPWGDDGQPIKGNNYLLPFDDYVNFLQYVVVQNIDCFQQNNSSIDLDHIIEQCVFYAHPPFVEGDTVVFYDVHGYEVDGYNDDYIQVPAIIPKTTAKTKPNFDYDWSKTVYWDLTELKTEGAPLPLGNVFTMSDYVDANLMHDIMTGKSATDNLHLVNKTLLEWYSKKQPIIETATYGSEFVAAQTCIEQIFDLCTTVCYLSVPISKKSCMFQDNKSVVDRSMQVDAKLHKCYTLLSFHHVREYNASKMVGFYFIFGESNKSDVLSEPWGYSQICARLKELLFLTGDTIDISE
jgi:hypothetical protein